MVFRLFKVVYWRISDFYFKKIYFPVRCWCYPSKIKWVPGNNFEKMISKTALFSDVHNPVFLQIDFYLRDTWVTNHENPNSDVNQTLEERTSKILRRQHRHFKSWAASWRNQQSACAPSEDSDQPGHPPNLIRVFVVRMKKAWILRYPLSA